MPSFIFMLSSSWALHLAEGHVIWLAAAFLPFYFLAFLKGQDTKRWLIAAAFFESLMFYEGGTYVFAFSLLFVGVYAVCHALETKSWRPILTFLAVNILAAALSAPKLLPVLEVITSHPRPTDAGSAMSWDDYINIFIARDSELGSGWWESGSYFGIVVVVIYLCSLSLVKKHLSHVAASTFLLLVSVGNFGKFSPWNMLHHLPFFSGLQVPTRSLIVFGFSVALLVGLFLGKLEDSPDRRIMFFVGLVVLIIGIDLFSLSYRIIPEALKPVGVSPLAWLFKKPPVAPVFPKLYRVSPAGTTGLFHSIESVHQPFSQIRVPDLQRFAHGAWSDQYLPLLQNRGVVDAYEPIPFERYARAVSDMDYRGEFHMLGKGNTTLLNWSPNRFVYHVKLQEKDRLVINQNHWPGWHASLGRLTRHDGLLAVDLPPGEYDVTVRYLPRSFLIGVGIFLAALVCIVAALFVSYRSHLTRPKNARASSP
ncbi:MAG TPA: hypothetical protein VK187_13875 [Geobacteraceae bacterium]|nr:hypothetical protein [Geobacteraceae bacterium]